MVRRARRRRVPARCCCGRIAASAAWRPPRPSKLAPAARQVGAPPRHPVLRLAARRHAWRSSTSGWRRARSPCKRTICTSWSGATAARTSGCSTTRTCSTAIRSSLGALGEIVHEPGVTWDGLDQRSAARYGLWSRPLSARARRSDQRLREFRAERDAFKRMTPYWQRADLLFERRCRRTPPLSAARPIGQRRWRTSWASSSTTACACPMPRLTRLQWGKDTPYETGNGAQARRRRARDGTGTRPARCAAPSPRWSTTAPRAASPARSKRRTARRSSPAARPAPARSASRPSARRSASRRAANRTATFTFYVGDRDSGVMTAFVPGKQAGGYEFTSALSVNVVRLLARRSTPASPANRCRSATCCRRAWSPPFNRQAAGHSGAGLRAGGRAQRAAALHRPRRPERAAGRYGGGATPGARIVLRRRQDRNVLAAGILMQRRTTSTPATPARGMSARFDPLWTAEHVVLFDEYRSRYPYAESGRLPGLPARPCGILDPFPTLSFLAAVNTHRPPRHGHLPGAAAQPGIHRQGSRHGRLAVQGPLRFRRRHRLAGTGVPGPRRAVRAPRRALPGLPRGGGRCCATPSRSTTASRSAASSYTIPSQSSSRTRRSTSAATNAALKRVADLGQGRKSVQHRPRRPRRAPARSRSRCSPRAAAGAAIFTSSSARTVCAADLDLVKRYRERWRRSGGVIAFAADQDELRSTLDRLAESIVEPARGL